MSGYTLYKVDKSGARSFIDFCENAVAGAIAIEEDKAKNDDNAQYILVKDGEENDDE